MEENNPYISPVLDITPYRNHENIFDTKFRGVSNDTFNNYMLNRDLMERSQNFSIAAWNMQNQYDSPEKQLERFRAAGITDSAAINAILGGQSVGGEISSPSSPSVANVPSGSEFEKIANMIGTGANAFKDVNSAITSLIDNQTRGESNNLDIRIKRANIKNLKEIIKGNKKQNRLLDSEIDRFDKLTPVEVQKGYAEIDRLKEEILLLQKQQEESQSQTALNNAETGLVVEKAGTEKYNKLIQGYRYTMITTFGFDPDSSIISLGVQAILNGHGEELLNGIQNFLKDVNGEAPDLFTDWLRDFLKNGGKTALGFKDIFEELVSKDSPLSIMNFFKMLFDFK